MRIFTKKQIIAISLVVVLICGALIFWKISKSKAVEELPVITKNLPKEVIIGTSLEGRPIKAYTYLPTPISSEKKTEGSEKINLAFVGGIHGGYEWNSVLLAYTLMDYLEANPKILPENLVVTVIPSANPDGLFKVIGKEGRFTLADVPSGVDESIGRFNANGVDLNRNFDCKWQSEALWKGKTVGAGEEAFSEPESQAMKNFVLESRPKAVVFWHSQANAVYASECEDGILPETLDIMNTYAVASQYPAIKSFDSYAVTGDAEGWLASIGIPAITVELKSHKTIEWDRNLAGIKALFDFYSQKNKI